MKSSNVKKSINEWSKVINKYQASITIK